MVRQVEKIAVAAVFFLAWASPCALAVEFTTSDTCGSCHRDIYRMWEKSAHARSMEDPVFLGSYRETEARLGASVARVCIGCHAPMADVSGDTELAKKTPWEGVTCDFCHSMVSVDMSGRVPKRVLEVGDIKRGPVPGAESTGHQVAYSELHVQSRVCAPCHEYANPDGTAVLTTYSEWKDSQAAADGQTCQSCHMGLTRGRVVDPRVKRDSAAKVNLHEMPGGHSLQQLHKALAVAIRPRRSGDDLEVNVRTTNKGAGHAVPTGMPGRSIHMVLTVSTSDGKTLEERRTYGKFFVDGEGKPVTHVADYFTRGVTLDRDTRIQVDEVRNEAFRFTIGAEVTAYVTVKLHYEHAPRGPDEDRTFLTFLSETRLVQPQAKSRGGAEP
jgi:hypothetical protein